MRPVTRTEQRLTDALGARARAVRAGPRPFPATRPARRWDGQRAAWWLAPAGAAAAIVLVLGLSTAITGVVPGSGRQGQPAAVPRPRYYVQSYLDGKVVVRSVATGRVTATVPVPRPASGADRVVALAPAGHGEFLAAAVPPGTSRGQVYRFTVTGSGHVTGFAAVRGGTLGDGQHPYELAATPDGSRIAVAVHYTGLVREVDQIIVIDTMTGAQSHWRDGQPGANVRVASLSWTSDPARLVFLYAWCPPARSSSQAAPLCQQQVRAIVPAAAGGAVDSGQLLLRRAGRPGLAQVLISPDGATITAVTVTADGQAAPPSRLRLNAQLRVERFSAATGKRLGVLYRRPSDAEPAVMLRQDVAGQHWLLSGVAGCPGHCEVPSGSFNGWISHGHLVPIPPAGPRFGDEAW
jgi:hypothetical protein